MQTKKRKRFWRGIYYATIALLILLLTGVFYFFMGVFAQQLDVARAALSQNSKQCGITMLKQVGDLNDDLTYQVARFDLSRISAPHSEYHLYVPRFLSKYQSLLSSISIITPTTQLVFQKNALNYYDRSEQKRMTNQLFRTKCVTKKEDSFFYH